MKILHEDRDIIVCEKPAGVASQNERGWRADMVSLLLAYEKEKGAGNPYIGVVHRLDKVVGGVMVYAKNKTSAAVLSRQIADHQVKKKYYAVVCGRPEKSEGTWEDYLLRDGRNNVSKVVPKGTKDSKKAILTYRVLESVVKENLSGQEEWYTLVEVELLTGRHHQIRVQFASRNLPLAGDRKYNPNLSTVMGRKGLLLYSYYLEFNHPSEKKKVEFQSIPSQADFQEFSCL